MNHGRKRTIPVLATVLGTALGGSLLVASPSHADPDIEDVQARVDRLYREAEQASERYNAARIKLDRTRSTLKSLRADVERERAKVDRTRDHVAALVVAEYQGQTFSSTGQAFMSEDPDTFLSQMATMSAYEEQQASLMAAFAEKAERLEARESAVHEKVTKISETKQTLAEEKAEVSEKAAAAAELLEELEAEAEARRARAAAAQAPTRSGDRDPIQQEASSAPAPAASGGASAVVDYALAQVGDAYVWGAMGESAFDCSGLTMRAWAQAGVSLPHSSTAQMSSGTAVSQSQLQPGDLVFYYSPVSHVGIYIGDGQIVHAANPSTGVSVAPVNSMPYSGAVRPG